MSWEDNEEIQIFREYLRIPSVHPNINYEPCVEFLKRQANSIGLQFQVFYPSVPTIPMCVITYPGTIPEMPSIMLNSHMDVVPVSRENWTHDPFAADIDENGKIFARGTQDTKAIGTQYLAALRYFVAQKIQFKRTIHVTFAPEEEMCGIDGMKDFVHTEEFKNLNVGFMMDEGAPMPNDKFMVFHGERSTWRLEFTITGDPGHGSLILPNNAAVKLQKLLTKFIEYRESEANRFPNIHQNIIAAGLVTSVNPTKINGGVQTNVIPSEYKMAVDIRVALDVDHEELLKKFERWCEEAGEGISLEFEVREPKCPVTPVDDSNKYWKAFETYFNKTNIILVPIICPGATDARFVRRVGIPAIGFSPMRNLPLLAHAHNEYVTVESYLEGIEIYKGVIPYLANLD